MISPADAAISLAETGPAHGKIDRAQAAERWNHFRKRVFEFSNYKKSARH
jgi:hypothetical protein